jgi:hypothetical protein
MGSSMHDKDARSSWDRLGWRTDGALAWGLVLVVLSVIGCAKADLDDGQATEPTKPATVAQPLEPAEWPLEAVVATNSIQLKDRLEVTGDVAVTQASPGPVLSSGAELVLDSSAKVTGNVKADTLKLAGGSVVTGNATYNQKSGSGTVQGTSSSPLALPLPITIPNLPTISPGTQNVQVAASQTSTIAAGAYASVALANGNGGIVTKLILSGGIFHMKDLTLGTDSRVECSAACEIRVQGRLLVQARSYVGPANVAGLGSGNVQVFVKGTNRTSDPNSVPSAGHIDNDAQLKAYFFSPNGTARFGDRGKLFGKVLARDVLFSLDGDATGQQLPLITQHPVSITVNQGQPATFSVAVVGQGLSFQWQRGTKNITGATSQQYTIASTTSKDNAATFRVVIRNVAGSVTSNSATLTVNNCASSDATCNGLDDDCSGQVDEDYVPTCSGTSKVTCLNGTVQTTQCSDGDACNGAESCSAGSCVPGTPPVVDDGNPCTTDGCNSSTGVQHAPVAAGTPCPDGNVCNGAETCNASGACVEGSPPQVDDGNSCTADSCDPVNGPQHAAAPVGTPCLDSTVCNGVETCNANAECVPGTPPVVDDGNPCTVDSCDPASGVRHVPDDTDPACRLAVADKWTVGTSPTAYRFGTIAPNAQGNVLAVSVDNVVSVSSSGQVTNLLSEKTGRVMLSDDGDSFTMLVNVGMATGTGYRQYSAAGVLMAEVNLPNVGWARPVPGTDKVFVPDVEADSLHARMRQARFVSAAGFEQGFDLPSLRLARVTPAYLVYTTDNELVRVTHDGVETWRVPLALHTYKVSANGEQLIGVLDGGGSRIVHVSLATGTVSNPVGLASALWNLAAAPGGQYTAATTQTAVYVFYQGELASVYDLPVAYANSMDVSDQGRVVIGGQRSDFVTMLIVIGFGASNSWTQARGRDNDGYRPFVRFFPDGSGFAASERSGLVAFSFTGSP